MKKQSVCYISVLVIAYSFISWSSPINSTKYPNNVEVVLAKAGNNRLELEKALRYFKEKGDEQMLQALYFLIANMDIHYSETYYLRDKIGRKIEFNELDYPNIDSAIVAFDSLRVLYKDLEFHDTIIYDVTSITGQFLIDNVNHAFAAWRQSKFSNISFGDFCEYILPYRVTVEPIQEWRSIYRSTFQWETDSLHSKTLERVLDYIRRDYRTWFTSSYGRKPLIENEPLSRLSSLQLLFRKRGACEDIAALQVFCLRSQGVPVSYDIIPKWATSVASHFVNTVFNEKMQSIKFDVTNNSPVNGDLAREPAKVLRITYSKQPEVIASKIDWRNIPPCQLRTRNYIDVTNEWWEASDVTVGLFKDISREKIAYANVFNNGKWNTVWWGEIKNDSVTFSNMPKGVVILPVYYKRGRTVSAGYPIVNGYNHELHLVPDTINKRAIEIKQQEHYLIFRPGKRYELFYWDRDWKSLGIQIPNDDDSFLCFKNVPENVLLRLVPEYSTGKERPFIVTRDGERYWW